MKRQKPKQIRQDSTSKARSNATESSPSLYDLSTPGWDRYYQEIRKRVRFPRYYKKLLNW